MDSRTSGAAVVDRLVFALILGFCAGVVSESFLTIQTVSLVLVAVMGGIFFVLSLLNSKIGLKMLFVSIFMFSFVLGIVRMEYATRDDSSLSNSIGRRVSLEGNIDEPAAKESGQSFTLSFEEIGIHVSAGLEPKLSYGDKVRVSGILEKPANFLTNQGTEFDYVSYLYKDDIFYVIQNADVSVVSKGEDGKFLTALLGMKNWILSGYRKILPKKEADLLGGLTLGSKSSIDPKFRDDLVATGTIHIIALSGYNVTIVANALRKALVGLPGVSPVIANSVGAIGIILFVLMTGAQSSAIRAGVMALVALFARATGRTYDAVRALICAGFLMVLWNPKFLVYDVSFELSFTATLGILYLTPFLERAFIKIPKRIAGFVPLRELLSTTLAAQIAVMPFILYKMGTLSLVALPANAFILPVIPIIMALGTGAGLLGSVSTILAYPFSIVTHWLLLYIQGIVGFFAGLPFAAVTISHVSIWVCLILYLVIIWVVFLKRRAYSEKK